MCQNIVQTSQSQLSSCVKAAAVCLLERTDGRKLKSVKTQMTFFYSVQEVVQMNPGILSDSPSPW